MKKFAIIIYAFLSAFTLSAQQNRTGSVELMEVESNGNIQTFLVEGISEKKGDVLSSAKETLFYKLLYEGVKGVNNGNKLIEYENKYWLNQFLSGNNAPYNAYIQKITPDGTVQKDGTVFYGKHVIVLNYAAFCNTLKVNGIINHRQAAAPVPKKEDNRILFSTSGVGPLKAGAKYTLGPDVLNRCSLPSSYAGLYSHIDCDRNQFDGSFEIRCLNNDDEPILLATCGENDKVETFAVLSPNCKTAEGVSIHNTAAEILAKGASDASWKLVDGDRVYWHYVLYLNGVYFLFKEGDGVNGKVKSAAKPIALSNKKYGILDLEFLL